MTLLALAVLLGYAVGSISPATLIARRRGIDLASVGSGNPGAANAGRALGRRTGVLVAVFDVVKGAAPAAGFGALDHRAGLVAGVAAVLGHVTSPLLKGKGGKGVATAAGAVLGSHPLWAPIVLLTWLVVLAASRWIALASVLAGVSVVVVAAVAGQDVLWAIALAAIIGLRHRRNFRRMSTGAHRRPQIGDEPPS